MNSSLLSDYNANYLDNEINELKEIMGVTPRDIADFLKEEVLFFKEIAEHEGIDLKNDYEILKFLSNLKYTLEHNGINSGQWSNFNSYDDIDVFISDNNEEVKNFVYEWYVDLANTPTNEELKGLYDCILEPYESQSMRSLFVYSIITKCAHDIKELTFNDLKMFNDSKDSTNNIESNTKKHKLQ